jgi:hypothetical protein
MTGTWSKRGSSDTRRRQRRGAGVVRTAVARRAVTLRTGREMPELSETDWVGTVALGRAQFGAQYCFATIQTLLRFQNTK